MIEAIQSIIKINLDTILTINMSSSNHQSKNKFQQEQQHQVNASQNSHNLPYQSEYPHESHIQNQQEQYQNQDFQDQQDQQQRKGYSSGEEEQPQMDNLTILMANIKYFCFKLFTEQPVSTKILESSKPIILHQIHQFQEDALPAASHEGFPNFENLFELIIQDQQDFAGGQKLDQVSYVKNLIDFEAYMRQLYQERVFQQPIETAKQTAFTIQYTSSKKSSKLKEKYLNKINIIIQALWKQMWFIIEQDTFTIQRLDQYDIYKKNIQTEQAKQQSPRIIQELQQGHFRNELINCKIQYPLSVFEWVNPPLHRQYISQVNKAYFEVVPIKIKFICPGKISESPVIDTQNYFNQDIEADKAVLFYPNPKTKKMVQYSLLDICKISTFQKQYMREIQFPSLKWTFSPDMKYTIIPDGRIFGIGCRTSKQRIDPSMYEFTSQKVSKRGQLPQAKRDFSMLYLKDCIYIIGGSNVNEPCSKKNYRYLIKQKKWETIAESNYALRKPTICTFDNRYIFKCSGINEFNYINKGIQMYDPQTNAWSIVRSSARSALDQVEILEDSLAVQINNDQIFVFSGKNANQFQTDSGFVFNITQIRQRKKRAPKVSGQFWNVSLGLRNIYSYFGLFSQSNVIVHGNCIYGLRKKFSNLMI